VSGWWWTVRWGGWWVGWVGWVAVVASGCAVGVDPGWWVEGGEPVWGDVDVPAVVVDDPVVVSAEQDEVGAGGFPEGFPVHDVVADAPFGGAVAAIEVSLTTHVLDMSVSHAQTERNCTYAQRSPRYN
jgi:hypothetical protein